MTEISKPHDRPCSDPFCLNKDIKQDWYKTGTINFPLCIMKSNLCILVHSKGRANVWLQFHQTMSGLSSTLSTYISPQVLLNYCLDCFSKADFYIWIFYCTSTFKSNDPLSSPHSFQNYWKMDKWALKIICDSIAKPNTRQDFGFLQFCWRPQVQSSESLPRSCPRPTQWWSCSWTWLLGPWCDSENCILDMSQI